MRPLSCIVVAGSLFLAACAHQIETPLPEQPARRYSDSVEKRLQLARRLQSSGDLTAAATQWQVLTILEPDERSFRQELESTRAAIASAASINYDKGMAAKKNGDSEEAAHLMLRVLALDPDHDRAAQVLRDIETERIGHIQSARASRARRGDEYAKNHQEAAPAETAEYHRTYDLEQTIELFTAGDAEGGLRELQRYVSANPGDKAGRKRIADIVFEQARNLDNDTTRERAVVLYEQALRFRGEPQASWSARLAAARVAVANDYYDKGMRSYRSDLELAIKHWETCLRFNPQHANCGVQLKKALSFRKQLKRIEENGAK